MKSYTLPLAASGWIALAATTLPPFSVLRVVVTLLFIAVCPGIAAVRIARPFTPASTDKCERLFNAAVVVSASLALTTTASESLLLAGVFTMPRGVMALAAVTTLLAVVPGVGTRDPQAC